MAASITTSTIGYPRIGPNRELKKALEAFWTGKITEADLIGHVHQVELSAWRAQKEAGIDLVACDGTMYDQTLDVVVALGLLPERFASLSGLDSYYAAARGKGDIQAMDMSKFFDTNYQ